MKPSRALQTLFACLLATSMLAAAGCDKILAGMEPPEEVTQARIRGRDEAIYRNYTKKTDCGALTDKEERYGCADYIEHMHDKD